jgi:translation initiation factor 2 alpha subunit (eIF-2alpha)
MTLEEGEIVFCTVDRIIGTNVFVKLMDGNRDVEGCIVMSEIAPGRIRNIRDYVVPKKQIVCKILRISGDRIDLSLRRVTLKEQKEVKERFNQEKSYESILKSVLGDKAGKIIELISKKGKIYDFLNEAKENSEELEIIVGKEDAKKILEIINSQQKKKKVVLKREFSLTTNDSNGIEKIKKLLGSIGLAKISYISAGNYVLKIESDDLKRADNELRDILVELEKDAKKMGAEFSIIKK